MKALSLTQPWASLVAAGAKKIETRSFRVSHRGWIAIHAAKAFPGEAKRLCESRMFCRAMGWPESPNPLTQDWLDDNAARIKGLPLGCVVAVARLLACVPTGVLLADRAYGADMTEQERAFGNYDTGRWGWILTDVKPLSRPIPAKGALGLWEWNGLDEAYQEAMLGR
jgi:activating signal cointegrator 1